MTKWLGNGGSDLCCEAENHTLAKHNPQAPLHRLMCSANDIPPVLFLSQLSSSCWGCILWRRVTSDRLSLPSPLLLTLSSWLPSNSSPRKGSLKGWSRGAGKAGPVAPSHATPVLPSVPDTPNTTPLFHYLHSNIVWINSINHEVDPICTPITPVPSQPEPVSSRLDPPQPRPSLDSVSSVREEIISEINLPALLRSLDSRREKSSFKWMKVLYIKSRYGSLCYVCQ